MDKDTSDEVLKDRLSLDDYNLAKAHSLFGHIIVLCNEVEEKSRRYKPNDSQEGEQKEAAKGLEKICKGMRELALKRQKDIKKVKEVAMWVIADKQDRESLDKNLEEALRSRAGQNGRPGATNFWGTNDGGLQMGHQGDVSGNTFNIGGGK